MTKFLVLHCSKKGSVPGMCELSEEQKQELLEKEVEPKTYEEGAKFLGSYLSQEGLGSCLWEAPSAECIQRVLERIEEDIPYDSIVPVTKVF